MLDMGSINISGTSQIDGKAVVYFSASYNRNQANSYSSTKSISDMESYVANQEQCNADCSEFDSAAMDIVNQIENAQ